ncbi:MAG: hypothetical protein ACOY90_20100 [Candidatus Zhuqueibacterota bacterium]
MKLLSKRSLSFLLVVFLLCTLIISCDKDNPAEPKPEEDSYLWIHFKSDSTKIEFEALPKIDADGEEAIQLSSFIDTTLVAIFRDKNGNPYDARKLYAYQVKGEDGFSASSKGYLNNTWEQLSLGHIITATRQVVFPDDKIDLAGAYNVKSTLHIFLHRKFDIITPDTTTFVELRALNQTSITNLDGQMENALVLKDFVTTLVTAPESRTFNMRSLDDFGPSSDMTWEQFQTGYWLMSSESTMFTDPAFNSGRYKVKVLEKILVN